MLYYLTTKKNEEHNELFRTYLQKKLDQVSEWINVDFPERLKMDGVVRGFIRDMETRTTMAIMDTNENVHDPLLLCGMNEKGILWNEFIAIPYGNEIVIIDEDGDKYSFEEFYELAGETCELSLDDEEVFSDIRAAQDEQDECTSDKWRIYVTPKGSDPLD